MKKFLLLVSVFIAATIIICMIDESILSTSTKVIFLVIEGVHLPDDFGAAFGHERSLLPQRGHDDFLIACVDEVASAARPSGSKIAPLRCLR